MAIKMSDSKSFAMEPMLKNRWLFMFTAVPGSTDDQTEALGFVAKSCNAPDVTFGDVKVERMNETYNFAGKPTWGQITCDFYDFIRNANNSGSELSAGDILNNWSNVIYNPFTGQMGYKTQYATSAVLAQLDPAGNIVRAWNLYGIFPTSIKYGDGFDTSSSEPSTVNAVFKYDLAVKIADAKTQTESA